MTTTAAISLDTLHAEPAVSPGKRIGLPILAVCLAILSQPATFGAEPARAHDTSRVVSIGGSVTEILYALGLHDRIVAVDTTSVFPPAALRDHPNVGYMRALSAEGVLSMAPTLILAIEGAGPREAIEVLKKASVPVVEIPDEHTAKGVAEKIRAIGNIMRADEKAAKLAARVESDLAAVAQATAKISTPTGVLFVLSLANNRVIAAGKGTAANAVITLAGARNVMSGLNKYALVSEEAILAARPEAILAMKRGGEVITADTMRANPALKQTPAVETGRLITMNGLYLLGFGPRTAHAVHDLAASLYPSAGLPELAARAWTRPPDAPKRRRR